MPRVKPAESFVWRAAAPPERARLLGAIAIAVSCGGLGVVAGRWSAQVAPADQGTRTAALIEAVAKETRDKATAQASAPADPLAVASVRGAEAPPSGEPAASAPTAPGAPGAPGAPDTPGNRDNGEEAAAEPPLAAVPAAKAPAREAQTEAPRRQAGPGAGRSTPAERPAAPNYQALRDYVLSR